VAYKVLRADAVDRDLELIFDFLVTAAEGFGESQTDAFERAALRIDEIETATEALGQAPNQGTLRPHLGNRVRSVTKERAVLYFEVNDSDGTVKVLAVFFGGQDHNARILLRLLTHR
jgi:plasmid stabilization system protein ParE